MPITQKRRVRSIARTDELRAAGVSARALAGAVRSGAIIRLRRGVYARADAPIDVRRAAAHGGMLCCLSAARQAGLWVVEHAGLHVAIGHRDRVHAHPGCRCVTHRTVRPVVLGRRSSIRRALLEILRCAGDEACFASLESALARGLLSSADREWLGIRMPAQHRWMLEFARDDAASGLESLLRFRLRADGIVLQAQVEIPGVGRVDFVLGDRLILEVDGVLGHADAVESRHKDLVRDAIAAGLGFDTLRFDYEMVVRDWPTVRAAVLGKLGLGLHVSVGVLRFG
ncbi:type IV toxin-antitoxin system AbiEi family antitoxin domain-containing protein [Agromyces sp. NPDC058136]|uniref:type IV toxin-antitoxin system AbiEi family antitoxin domain-containing protein n=1 Tax=Agromyces sp. NPDC058136 TaxID=3346354 RepID=UPI0036DEAF06